MLNYRLKNYFLALGLLFTAATVSGQKTPDRGPSKKSAEFLAKGGPLIEVNLPTFPQSSYAPAQLVQDVLVSGSAACGTPQITNVSVSPNDPVTDPDRFWGYFRKGTSNFPFQAGIVLTTGFARKAGNTAQTGIMSDNNGGGSDADLIAATGTTNSINNAGVLEFDFVPTSTTMKFNYIFASEEYSGSFSCTYDDAFALLLKPNTPGAVYTNLAVLPAGAGPVAVTNIHPANTGCGAVNPQYFGGMTNNGTNYTGRTAALTAEATVVPGQSYHIKMVIADARDSSYGSAVFLEAGSFDIGVQILGPNGVALPESINMCDNAPQTLTSSIQQPGATYQWSLNGTPIPGATSPAYTTTQPGTYCLSVTIPGNQCPGEACVTIVGGSSAPVQNTTLTYCFQPGNINFNLTLAEPAISSAPGVTYTYYENLADAQALNTNTIANPLSYTSPGGETVYVVVMNGFCPKIAELSLVKSSDITITIAPPAALNCSNPQQTLYAGGSSYPAGSTFSWTASAGGYIVSGQNTLSPVINSPGTYTLTITKHYQPGDIVCTEVASVDVIGDFTPPAVNVTTNEVTICVGESAILTATGGVTYNWVNNAATGNTITVSPTTTTTYQVYAIGPNGCQSAEPAEVTVTVVPAITSTMPPVTGQICVDDEILLDAGTGPDYTYLWSTGETTQTITVDTPGIYTVTIDNGECSKLFTTEVIAAGVPQVVEVSYQNQASGTIVITATNPSNAELEYSINQGITWQNSNVFENVPNNAPITIWVRVKRTTCVGVLEYYPFVVQNVITPNGDGVHDVVDFSAIAGLKGFKASFFDRYGKEIWKADKVRPIWDGRFQGRALPTTSYWYQINYEDQATKKPVIKSGWILLKNIN